MAFGREEGRCSAKCSFLVQRTRTLNPHEGGTRIISILQMNKLRQREVKTICLRSHSWLQRWDLNGGNLTPECALLNHNALLPPIREGSWRWHTCLTDAGFGGASRFLTPHQSTPCLLSPLPTSPSQQLPLCSSVRVKSTCLNDLSGTCPNCLPRMCCPSVYIRAHLSYRGIFGPNYC